MTGENTDLTGKRFGRLTVLEKSCLDVGDKGKTYYICRCDCGNMTINYSSDLTCNKTLSCGCYSRENTKQRKLKHGQAETRLYEIWQNMKKRCSNTRSTLYKNYGGRGITVCEEWQEFEPFRDWAMANGYSDDLSIDRIDVNGNYCPENCRWATRKEQANNTRKNHYLTYNGRTMTMRQWADELGVSYNLIRDRINKLGWSVEDALTTPRKWAQK